MNDLYRGFEIKPVAGGFVWNDETGATRFADDATSAPYTTSDRAMDGIDRHKRAALAKKEG